jgi:RimJ/RimL family protein N-acetyltransferase
MAFVHAIIDDQQPGSAFVDDIEAPRSALAFNHSGFAFALGDARPDLVGPRLPWLMVQPWMTAEPTNLWCSAPAWGPALRPFFKEERSRDEFHFEPASAPASATLPVGYRIVTLDEALAARWGDGLDPWVVRIWGGPAAFAKDAFGVGVLFGEALVTICTVCAVAGHAGEVEAEIEIGTAPEHRQKGLAVAAAVAFFEQCRERAVTPAWTCDSKNEPSQRAAARLGFREFRKVVGFPMTPDNLV